MLNRDRIFALQVAQQKHDDTYHRDIANLPTADRLKHMTLHFAKYTGYLAEALCADDQERVQRVLVDAFIISLATANSLTQDLSDDIDDNAAPANETGSLLTEFSSITGRMAKACESLDHLENIPFREVLQSANKSMFQVIVTEAARRGVDLRERYFERIRQVESKSFYRRLAKTKVT